MKSVSNKKTTFYVYKKGDLYLRIKTNTKKGKMFVNTFVKDIDQASYWKDKVDAKSWYVEKTYPDIKLVACGLQERKK